MRVKEMLWVSFGRIAQFALLLLTLRLATSYLSPSEMGKISIVIATVAFFALFMLNPIGMFINRRLHTWNENGLVQKYVTYFLFYLLVVAVLASLILVVFVNYQIIDLGISINWLVFLVCGSILIGTLNQFFIPSLNMFGYRGWFTILTLATISSGLLFAVILVQTISPRAEYWLSGLLIGQGIFAVVGKKIFYDKLMPKIGNISTHKLTWLHFQNLVGYAWPVAVAVGFGWIQSQGYRYLMQDQLGLNELGLFVAGFGISSGLISGFESIFATYFQPKFYERISSPSCDGYSKAWMEYARVVVPALLLASIFIIVVAPELTKMLLGADYKNSTQFIVWGALAELGRITTSVFGLAAHARMNTKMLLFPNFAGAVTAIVLISYLAGFYGAEGVGAGLVISSVITLVLTVILTNIYFNIKFSPRVLVKSMFFGMAIFAIYGIIGLAVGHGDNIFVALLKLFIIGLVFVYFQYLMLVPVLKSEAPALRGGVV